MKENKPDVSDKEEDYFGMPLIEGIAYKYWRKLVNQNWSNVSGEIENAIKEHIEKSNQFDKFKHSKLFDSSDQEIYLDMVKKARNEMDYSDFFKWLKRTFVLQPRK